MASRLELEAELRATMSQLFPKAIGKMKKHEIEHTLAAIRKQAEIKSTIAEPPVAVAGKLPRRIPTAALETDDTTISVPQLPKPRVNINSSLAEKAALRKSLGALSTVKKPVAKPKTPIDKPKGVMPPGLAAYRAKQLEEKNAALIAAGKKPKPITPPPSVEEDDIDPKAVRIVRAHAAERKPVGRPPKKATAAKPAGGAGTDSDAMMTAFQEFLKQRETAKVEVEDEDE